MSTTLVRLPVTLVMLLFAATAAGETRKWTSADGRFTTEAELVDYSEKDVRLKPADGKLVVVPLEKLSQKDREYAQTGANNVYRVAGYLQVANPRAGLGWKELSREVEDGETIIIVQSGTDPLEGIVQIIPQYYDQPAEAKDVRKQFDIAKLYVDLVLKQLQEGGLQPGEVVRPEFRSGRATRGGVYATTLRREDGVVIEFRVKSVFREKRIYHFQVFGKTKEMADKLAQVSNTLKELPPERDK
jgi:hypothetical protein